MYYGVKVKKEIIHYSDCTGERNICNIVPIQDINNAFEDGVKAIFKNYEDAIEYSGLMGM